MATLVAQHALKKDRYRKLRLIILTQQNFPFLYKAHTQDSSRHKKGSITENVLPNEIFINLFL